MPINNGNNLDVKVNKVSSCLSFVLSFIWEIFHKPQLNNLSWVRKRKTKNYCDYHLTIPAINNCPPPTRGGDEDAPVRAHLHILALLSELQHLNKSKPYSRDEVKCRAHLSPMRKTLSSIPVYFFRPRRSLWICSLRIQIPDAGRIGNGLRTSHRITTCLLHEIFSQQ